MCKLFKHCLANSDFSGICTVQLFTPITIRWNDKRWEFLMPEHWSTLQNTYSNLSLTRHLVTALYYMLLTVRENREKCCLCLMAHVVMIISLSHSQNLWAVRDSHQGFQIVLVGQKIRFLFQSSTAVITVISIYVEIEAIHTALRLRLSLTAVLTLQMWLKLTETHKKCKFKWFQFICQQIVCMLLNVLTFIALSLYLVTN